MINEFAVSKSVRKSIVIPSMSTSQGGHGNALAPSQEPNTSKNAKDTVTSNDAAVFISEWERAAEVHARNGAWHDVIHCCNEILQIQGQSKTNFNALHMIGIAYMELGRGFEAFVNLVAARDINPHHEGINQKICELNQERKQNEKNESSLGSDTTKVDEQTPVLGRRRNPEQASIESTMQNDSHTKRKFARGRTNSSDDPSNSHSVPGIVTGQLSESGDNHMVNNRIQKGAHQIHHAQGSVPAFVSTLNQVNMDPRMIHNRPNSVPRFNSAANPSHQIPSAVIIPQSNLSSTFGAHPSGSNIPQQANFTGLYEHQQQFFGHPIVQAHRQSFVAVNPIPNDNATATRSNSFIPAPQQHQMQLLRQHFQQIPLSHSQQSQIHSPLHDSDQEQDQEQSHQDEPSQDESLTEDDLNKEIEECEDRLFVIRSELNDCEVRLGLLKSLKVLREQRQGDSLS